MTDGPLIVQSDKTVLLEVDHELTRRRPGGYRAVRRVGAGARARSHVPHHAAGVVECRAAGHDAEQVVDALVSFSRYAVPQPLLVDIVDTMARYGRLQLVKHPAHGLMLVSLDRQCWKRFCVTRRSARCWAPESMTTPSSSTPVSGAGSSRCC